MPHDTPHVVVCRIVGLLQAFVTQAKRHTDGWLKTYAGQKHSPVFLLDHNQSLMFKWYIDCYRKLMNDVIADISTTIAPPEIAAVVVPLFSRLLDNSVDGLATPLPIFFQKYESRNALYYHMDDLYEQIEGMCTDLNRSVAEGTRVH